MPKKDATAAEPKTCTVAQFGAHIGMSARGVRDLISRGVVLKDSRERVLLDESRLRYIDSLRDVKSKHGGTLADARAKLAEAQLVEQNLKNLKLTGDLISIADAQVAWGKFGAVVRSSILSIPSRARQAMPHLTAHDGQTLRGLCVDVLTEAAENLDGGDVVGSSRDDLVADRDEIAIPPRQAARQKRQKLNA